MPVDLSGGPRAVAVEVADSVVEGDTWEVSFWLEGDGGVPDMRLDGRAVRGCRRQGDAAVCRFAGLRQGEHRLRVDGGMSLWARVGPWDWRDAVVYLVIPDRFRDGDPTNNGGGEFDRASPLARHGGDFRGLRSGLDHLTELGVNVVWTTPAVSNVRAGVPHEFGVHRGFHGYWPERLEEVDAHLGDEAELMEMTSDFEQAGVRTLMDVVVNHLGYGAEESANPELVRVPCPPEERSDEIRGCLFGLPDLRTESPSVAARVEAATRRWVGPDRGAHAVRLDAVKHVGRSFVRRLSDALRAERPDVWVVGEVWGADPVNPSYDVWFDEAGLDALYDFGFSGQALGFVTGRARSVAVAAALEGRMRAAASSGRSWLHFLNTHDTPSFLHRVGDPRQMRLATTLLMTVWGVPVLFSGDEVGRLAADWPHNRPDFPAEGVWDRRTLDHHRRLIELRRRHPALSRGDHRTLHAAGDQLVFLRWWVDASGGVADAVVVALNRSEREVTLELPIPPELSGAPPLPGLSANQDRLRLRVPPIEALILAPLR